MGDYTELKRLAEAANAVTGDVSVDIAISSERGPNQPEIDAVTAFVGAATPAAVLALIAENERLESAYRAANAASNSMLTTSVLIERDQLKAENELALREATDLAMAIWRRCYAKDSPNFQPFEKASSVNGQIDNMAAGLMSDLEKLRAENAGLKTGYEAYERVNAELKAEVEGLRKTLRPLLAHWDDLKVGESLNVDAARAALGQGEQS